MLDNDPVLPDCSAPPSSALAAPSALLMPDAYRSFAFASREDAAIWALDWICIGSHADIPNAGDLLPFTVGDHAVHVQRQTDGTLIGRFNQAQHGGCRTVPLQCQQGTKTPCSFTSCGHSLDRMPLRADEVGSNTPEMYQYLGLRPERLLPVRSAMQGPLIFVNLNPLGEEFDHTARTFAQAMPALADTAWERTGHAFLGFDGNWKLVGQMLAAGSATSVSNAVFTDRMALLQSECDAGDGQQCDEPTTALWTFPNLLILAQPGSLCVALLQPVAINRTRCRLSIFHAAGEEKNGLWLERLQKRADEIKQVQRAMEAWGTALESASRSGSLPFANQALSAWLSDMVASRFERTLDQTANSFSSITRNLIRIRSMQ